MGGTVTKGNRLQVMARRELERQGYLVHTAVRSAQRRGPIWISQTTDIFNAFDLIATRMEPPHPLRFVQVTTISHVSERIKKVDPIPLNPGIASVEIWAYVGGQKRLDRRYKDRRIWLPRNYFQVYLKTRNWEPDQRDRVAVGGAESRPEIRVERVRSGEGQERPIQRVSRKALRK
ncbi:MAG: hypothetical protein E6K19_07780 [Methanobacteriota archaeon]|nr:MAG: hypothetical protein E6K19_07780 [Euryarchaeota archaeon]